MRGKNARTLEHRLQYPECETEAQMIHGTHTLNHTLDRITWPMLHYDAEATKSYPITSRTRRRSKIGRLTLEGARTPKDEVQDT